VISVVVPTCDRPQALARCLEALARQQTTAPLEIVVVNDGRGDVHAPRARVVGAQRAGPAAARNLGARAAEGDTICFIDDDCSAAPDWAQRLADACEADAAAAGTTIADPAAGAPAAVAQLLTNTLMASSRDAASGALRFAPTCNLACRAEILRELPFDESFALAAGEDRDWCARLVATGATLRHVPRAVVVHRPQLDVRGFVRQQLRYGRGAVGFADTGGELAGAGFYRRLAHDALRGGAKTAALVALAQAAVAAGAASELLQQRLARQPVALHAAGGGDRRGDVGQSG
jgi:glycosyltransferase involved in cell wall biosynthesis